MPKTQISQRRFLHIPLRRPSENIAVIDGKRALAITEASVEGKHSYSYLSTARGESCFSGSECRARNLVGSQREGIPDPYRGSLRSVERTHNSESQDR